MMKTFGFLFVLALSLQAFAGGSVANGGNSVYCKAGPDFDLSHLYNVDYAVMIGRGHSESELVDLPNLTAYLNRFAALFEKIPFQPEIKAAFQLHRQAIQETFIIDPAIPPINLPAGYHCFAKAGVKDSCWMESYEMPNLTYLAGNTDALPWTCRNNFTHGNFTFVTTIARTETASRIFYELDPTDPWSEEPLQSSILAIHEFLWQITQDAEVNRQINWFLHSSAIDEMNASNIVDRLKVLGVPKAVFVSNH